jgi:hypothetical protein
LNPGCHSSKAASSPLGQSSPVQCIEFGEKNARHNYSHIFIFSLGGQIYIVADWADVVFFV